MEPLIEYKTGKLISDQEFEQWKSDWSPGQPIPDQIHQYMHEVVLPSIDAELKKWTSTF